MENKEKQYSNYIWYTLIFSIIGLILEIIYCMIEAKIKGNSKGLILGPLNIIYGISACIIIKCLDKYKNKKIKIFILGAILGTAIQYGISFIIEATMGVRLWGYNWSKVSINERVCLETTVILGIFAVIAIQVLKKCIDKLINKINPKIKKIIEIIIIIILTIETILGIWALATYSIRAKETLNGKNYISNNNIIEKFQNTVFSNDIIEKIYSKARITDSSGEEILIKDIK